MAADSCGVMGMLRGLSAGVHVSWSAVFRPGCTMSGGAAGGSSQGRVVSVVGNVTACVPGGGDASLADLHIGIDNANQYVVLIRQIVQYARVVGDRVAQTACQNR